MKTRPTALLALSAWALTVMNGLAQPTIDTQPADQTSLAGSDATFCVVATGTPPLSYQWRDYSTAFVFTNIPGATNPCLVLTNVQPTTDRFAVVVYNPSGSNMSRLTKLTVLVPPIITNQPTDRVVGVGENYTNRVVVGGTMPLSFQWYFVADDATNLLAGKTANPLYMPTVQFANSGGYFVVVTNLAGTNISLVATMQVVTLPPAIVVQPTNATVEVGQTYGNQVVIRGTAPLSYQWYFGPTALVGKTASVLSIPNIQLTNAGDYWVTITNLYGAATSITSRLDVIDARFAFTRMTNVANFPMVNDPGSYWGSAWVDYDNDGYIDLFVSNRGTTSLSEVNRLYHNNGDRTFTRMNASQAGDLVGETNNWYGCGWGDYDNDGWPDVFVISYTNTLYRNVAGVFRHVRDAGVDGMGNQGSQWVDYDRDGWLDLFQGRGWRPSPRDHNTLYHNQGDGSFAAVTNGPIYEDDVYNTQKFAWGDYDGDGWPDLVVADPGGLRTLLYRNQGTGTFERITNNAIAQDTGSPLCPSWVDYDNDGRLDLYMGHWSDSLPSKLFHNEGNGQFTILQLGEPGQNGPGAWGDYDNDGDLDLFINRGQMADYRNQFFQNNGNGTFTELKSIAPATFAGRSHTAIWGDYDNDGFLDLFVPHLETLGNSLLYHNATNGNHWLMAKLEGTVANRAAIGTRVKVQATIFGSNYWQMRDIGPSTSDGQNDPRAHFGLGDATNVETLRIEWPSGHVTEIHDVAANQILTVQEPPALDCVGLVGGALQLRVVGNIGERYDVLTCDEFVEPAPPRMIIFPPLSIAPGGTIVEPVTKSNKWSLWKTVTNTSRTMPLIDPSPNAPQRFYKATPAK